MAVLGKPSFVACALIKILGQPIQIINRSSAATVPIADHLHQLKSGHRHTSHEDVMGQDVLAVVLFTSQLPLWCRSVDINQRAWVAHLAQLVEEATISARDNVFNYIVHHDHVERCVFVWLRQGKVGDGAYKMMTRKENGYRGSATKGFTIEV